MKKLLQYEHKQAKITQGLKPANCIKSPNLHTGQQWIESQTSKALSKMKNRKIFPKVFYFLKSHLFLDLFHSSNFFVLSICINGNFASKLPKKLTYKPHPQISTVILRKN